MYIETQAALFASETGYMSTNVDYLVNTGYVEADNEFGEVISPKDQKILNYHVVTITKEGDNYYYKDKDCTQKIKGLIKSKKARIVSGGTLIIEQPYAIREKYIMFR